MLNAIKGINEKRAMSDRYEYINQSFIITKEVSSNFHGRNKLTV